MLRMSVSIRSSLAFAMRRESASMPKVMYLRLMRPLLPFVSWFCSISEYSLRMSLNSSSCSGMLICFLNSLMLVLWLMKENWTKIELSK